MIIRYSIDNQSVLHLSEGKKLCKKNKVEPTAYQLKHYKDGEYHKDYDRRETVHSMATFLRDPSGDVPWDEDEQGVDVVHINDVNVSGNYISGVRMLNEIVNFSVSFGDGNV